MRRIVDVNTGRKLPVINQQGRYDGITTNSRLSQKKTEKEEKEQRNSGKGSSKMVDLNSIMNKYTNYKCSRHCSIKAEVVSWREKK